MTALLGATAGAAPPAEVLPALPTVEADARFAANELAVVRGMMVGDEPELQVLSFDVWVLEVVGSPDPEELYHALEWPAGSCPEMTHSDVGTQIRFASGIFGAILEEIFGDGWRGRAMAAASELEGLQQVSVEYDVHGPGIDYVVRVHSPYVDLERVEVVEGTYVSVIAIDGLDLLRELEDLDEWDDGWDDDDWDDDWDDRGMGC